LDTVFCRIQPRFGTESPGACVIGPVARLELRAQARPPAGALPGLEGLVARLREQPRFDYFEA